MQRMALGSLVTSCWGCSRLQTWPWPHLVSEQEVKVNATSRGHVTSTCWPPPMTVSQWALCWQYSRLCWCSVRKSLNSLSLVITQFILFTVYLIMIILFSWRTCTCLWFDWFDGNIFDKKGINTQQGYLYNVEVHSKTRSLEHGYSKMRLSVKSVSFL